MAVDSTTTSGEIETASETCYLLAFNGRCAAQALAKALHPLGIRPQHLMVMTLIERSPGITQRECVAETRIDPSTMVSLLDELEDLGLAERRRNPRDRRKHAVHLTAKGKRRLDQGRQASDEVTEELLQTLEPAERETFRELLEKVALAV